MEALDGMTLGLTMTNSSGSSYEHSCAIYIFVLCSSVTLALGVLTVWHSRLISKGETSIEIHINRTQRIKLKKKGLVSTMVFLTVFGIFWRKQKTKVGKKKTVFHLSVISSQLFINWIALSRQCIKVYIVSYLEQSQTSAVYM